MALIKKINQFNLDSNLTGGELILTMDNGITKSMLLDDVKDFVLNNIEDINITGGTYSNGVAIFTNTTGGTFSVTGFYTGSTSLPELGFNITPNEITQDITLPDDSTVYYYGELNIASGYTLTIPSGTTLELINPNITFITGDTDNNSVLIGGVDNVIDSSAINAVVIGGVNITGVTSNTVYVPKLNINNLTTGNTINNLGVDSNGNIIISDLLSLSDLGFNITPRPTSIINQNIVLPDNTDVTYPSPLIMDIDNTIIVPIDTILIIT